jgi:hypothetical protein
MSVDWVRKEKFDSTLIAGVSVSVGFVAPVSVAVAPRVTPAPVGKVMAAGVLAPAVGELAPAAGELTPVDGGDSMLGAPVSVLVGKMQPI